MEEVRTDHDLQVVPEYADGEIVGVLPGDAGYLLLIPGSGRPAYATRSFEELRTWRVVCSCGAWRSAPIQRVHTSSEEDVPGLRVYAAGDPGGVPERSDVVAVAIDLWTQGHVAPMRAVEAVRDAHRRVEAALLDLDDAVAAARRAGATWEAIGRGAGITRQSAHGRWGGRDVGGKG